MATAKLTAKKRSLPKARRRPLPRSRKVVVREFVIPGAFKSLLRSVEKDLAESTPASRQAVREAADWSRASAALLPTIGRVQSDPDSFTVVDARMMWDKFEGALIQWGPLLLIPPSDRRWAKLIDRMAVAIQKVKRTARNMKTRGKNKGKGKKLKAAPKKRKTEGT